VSPLYEPSG